nr:immunoglobulin light chain junction region [Macaca mulatta]
DYHCHSTESSGNRPVF